MFIAGKRFFVLPAFRNLKHKHFYKDNTLIIFCEIIRHCDISEWYISSPNASKKILLISCANCSDITLSLFFI